MVPHKQINQCDTHHINKNMVISMDSENTVDKSQHPFMIKTLTNNVWR